MKDIVVAGSLSSSDMTPVQNKLANYLGYFSKMALTISLTYATVKVERSNGLQRFLQEKELLEKQKGKLSPEELKQLENTVRYDIIETKPLGNSTAILNHMFHSVYADNKYQELISAALEEAMRIAERQNSIHQAREQFDSRDMI